MAGVERFELPTRADFWHWRNPLLCQLNIAATSQTTCVVLKYVDSFTLSQLR